MAKLVKSIKLAWLKGVEALGNGASHLASNAKFKVQEMNLEASRREILSKLSITAFELWQNGEALPAPLDAMLKEVKELDEKLNALREQKRASVDAKPEEEPVQAEVVPLEETPVAVGTPEEGEGQANQGEELRVESNED